MVRGARIKRCIYLTCTTGQTLFLFLCGPSAMEIHVFNKVLTSGFKLVTQCSRGTLPLNMVSTLQHHVLSESHGLCGVVMGPRLHWLRVCRACGLLQVHGGPISDCALMGSMVLRCRPLLLPHTNVPTRTLAQIWLTGHAECWAVTQTLVSRVSCSFTHSLHTLCSQVRRHSQRSKGA